MKKRLGFGIWVLAILAAWLCVAATLDVWLLPPITTPSDLDVIPLVQNGGGTGTGRKISIASLRSSMGTGFVPKTTTVNGHALSGNINVMAADVAPLSLATQVTGILPIANIATGVPNGLKFVRDDGTLAVPAGGGNVTGTSLTSGNILKGG